MKNLILVILFLSQICFAKDTKNKQCLEMFNNVDEQIECQKFTKYHKHGNEVCKKKNDIYPLINEYILQDHFSKDSMAFIEKNKDNLDCDLFTK